MDGKTHAEKEQCAKHLTTSMGCKIRAPPEQKTQRGKRRTLKGPTFDNTLKERLQQNTLNPEDASA